MWLLPVAGRLLLTEATCCLQERLAGRHYWQIRCHTQESRNALVQSLFLLQNSSKREIGYYSIIRLAGALCSGTCISSAAVDTQSLAQRPPRAVPLPLQVQISTLSCHHLLESWLRIQESKATTSECRPMCEEEKTTGWPRSC